MDDLNECTPARCALFMGECKPPVPESQGSKTNDIVEEAAKSKPTALKHGFVDANSMQPILTKSVADKHIHHKSPFVDSSTLIDRLEEWALDNNLLLNPPLFEELADVYDNVLAGKEKINGIDGTLQELTERMAQIKIWSEQSCREREDAKLQGERVHAVESKVNKLQVRVNEYMNLMGRHRDQKVPQPKPHPQYAGGTTSRPSNNERILALQKQVIEMRRAFAKAMAAVDQKPLAAQNEELAATNQRLREDIAVLKGSQHDLRRDVTLLKGSNRRLREDVAALQALTKELVEECAKK